MIHKSCVSCCLAAVGSHRYAAKMEQWAWTTLIAGGTYIAGIFSKFFSSRLDDWWKELKQRKAATKAFRECERLVPEVIAELKTQIAKEPLITCVICMSKVDHATTFKGHLRPSHTLYYDGKGKLVQSMDYLRHMGFARYGEKLEGNNLRRDIRVNRAVCCLPARALERMIRTAGRQGQ